jgi:hypothetical protein
MRKKTPPADPQTCGSCRFFLANQVNEYGQCRRFPPATSVQDGAAVTLWPVVAASDWCGDFAHVLHS